MNKNSKSPPPIQDDRLTRFTDHVLTGKATEVEMEADEELLKLEQTILRLQNAFPPAQIDSAAVKRMQVRLNARIKRESQEKKQPFWKKWFEPQARLQLGMAFAAMALLIGFAIFSPTLSPGGSSTTATALTPVSNTFLLMALAGLILIFIWIKRRK